MLNSLCVIPLWAVCRPGQAVTLNSKATYALAYASEDVRVKLTMHFPERWMKMYYSQLLSQETVVNLSNKISLLEKIGERQLLIWVIVGKTY